MRLIDADDLIRKHCTGCQKDSGGCDECPAVRMINEQPEVTNKGHWLYSSTTKPKFIICSRCGCALADYKWSRHDKLRYCPKCGADNGEAEV